MRVVITNFGTTGDLQPFLALAVELQQNDYRVEMAFSPHHESRVRSHSFPFHPIGEDYSEEQRRVNLEWAADPGSVDHYKVLEPITRGLPQAFEQLKAASAGADLLISGPAMPAARMIHELTGIPFVSIQLSHFGGSGTPEFQKASDQLINPFRLSLGLPRLADPLTKDANSPQLALYAISRHILKRPGDWPQHYHRVGYFFLEDKVNTSFPELEKFITEGERPVIITFGSMSDEDPEKLTDLFLEAVEETGCRAVLQQDWSALQPRNLPANVFPAGFVPHTWLMPRGSCIVHHGGGGTAGAVFASGIPSVFVPHGFMFDQYYLGILAEEMGVAGKAIPQTELTAEWLSAAIRNVLDDPSYSEKAAALGVKIRAEQGVRKARELIDALAERLGLREVSVSSTPRRNVDADRHERLRMRRARRRV